MTPDLITALPLFRWAWHHDRASLMPLESSRYLYLARLLTYGSEHPIKVGISKNVRKRMHQLGFSPSLLAVFEFETEKLARIVERATLDRFPTWRNYPHLRSNEFVLADYREISAYVQRFNPSRFIALL